MSKSFERQNNTNKNAYLNRVLIRWMTCAKKQARNLTLKRKQRFNVGMRQKSKEAQSKNVNELKNTQLNESRL